MTQRILILLTSHDELGDTGKATGFHWEEMTTPYWQLRDDGYKVDFASPAGGPPPAYEKGAVIGAICHGPAGLVGANLSNGEPLVRGKRVNSFTDAEEREAGLDNVVPYLLESRLRSLGAEGAWSPVRTRPRRRSSASC